MVDATQPLRSTLIRVGVLISIAMDALATVKVILVRDYINSTGSIVYYILSIYMVGDLYTSINEIETSII